MNPKQLRIIAIVLGVVVVLWGLSEVVGGGRDQRETVTLLVPISPEETDRVMLVNSGDTLEFRRADDAWTVNGFSAASDAITELFAAVANPPEAELISTSASVHARMGVDSANGKQLTFFSGDELIASIVVGNRGRGFNRSYVRDPNEDEVYSYNGPLTSLVGRQIDYWRNKVITDVSSSDIASVRVSRETGRYVLDKVEDRWMIDGDTEADSVAVHRLLQRFQPLRATSFATVQQEDSADFVRPDRTVMLLGALGDTLAALAFDSTDGGFWVRRGSDPTVYKVLRFNADRVTPADSTLGAQGESQ